MKLHQSAGGRLKIPKFQNKDGLIPFLQASIEIVRCYNLEY